MTNLARFYQLSWQILEHKFRYYEGEKYKLRPIADSEYDKLEAEYLDLCKKLDKPTSASSMVGFDYSRPSCLRVAEHLTKGKNLNASFDISKSRTTP